MQYQPQGRAIENNKMTLNKDSRPWWWVHDLGTKISQHFSY